MTADPADTEPEVAPSPPHDAEPEPTTDLAVPDDDHGHAALADLAAGAGLDVIPGVAELRGLAAMAVTLSAANAMPAHLRGKPNDVFLILLTGRELGLAPAASIRSLYVVNGQVTLPPKVRKGLVTRRGLGRVWPDPANNAESATWHCTRADEGHQQTYSFTFNKADAERAKDGSKTLWKKYTDQGYPQRLLSWRALGYLLDDVFSEVGVGLYAPDEVGAYVDEEGTPIIDVASTDPFPGHAGPRGAGGAAEPPALADEADRAGLLRRIHALPAEGKLALTELWKAPREGTEAMAKLTDLPARQLGRARAMVTSIEGRAKRGEWGDWQPPADPDTGEVAGAAGGGGTPGGDPVGSGGAAGSIPATATPAPDPTSPHQQAEAGRSQPQAVPTPPEAPATRTDAQGGLLCDRWEWCDELAGHPNECIDALGQTRPEGT